MKAREEGLSQWEDVLKGQANEANQGASKAEADLASQQNSLRERSAALEAEQRKAEGVRSGLEEREKAVAGREVEISGLEEGREARFMELERVKEKLSLLEKGLETERVDLGQRKVSCFFMCLSSSEMVNIYSELAHHASACKVRSFVSI